MKDKEVDWVCYKGLRMMKHERDILLKRDKKKEVKRYKFPDEL